MLRNFKVVHWQNIKKTELSSPSVNVGASTSAFNGSISEQPLGLPWVGRKANCLLRFDEYNSDLALKYNHILTHTPPIMPSLFTLEGWTLGGNDGMLLSDPEQTCLIGDSVGWSLEFAKWFSEQTYGAVWSSDMTEFSIDDRTTASAAVEDLGLFLSSPGQNIYGHWLLDYIPRLHALREHVVDVPDIRMTAFPPWVTTFLNTLGVRGRTVPRKDDRLLIRAGRVQLPGFLKKGYAIHTDFCRSAWTSFVSAVRALPSNAPDPSRTKLFVSRRGRADTRPIENIVELERIATRRGYRVVRPESLPLPDQAALFRQARIVIGQDGSGLHNIIFAEPGARLGVISLPERCNFWHASICNALDHSVAYVETKPGGTGTQFLDPARFNALMDGLEATT